MVAPTLQVASVQVYQLEHEHEFDGVMKWNDLYKKVGFPFSHGQRLEPAQKTVLEGVIKETLPDLAPDDKRYFLQRADEYRRVYAMKNEEEVLPSLPTYEAAQQQFLPFYARLDTQDRRAERERTAAVLGLGTVITLVGTLGAGELAAYFSDIRALQHVGAGVGALVGAGFSLYLGEELSSRLRDRHFAGRKIRRHDIDEQVQALFLQDVAAYVGRK